jgi:hypothetical protein
MSNWLKSVNKLLENLDGQAEIVADGEGLPLNMGKLLEGGRNVVSSDRSSSDYSSFEEDYDDDYDDEDDDEIPYSEATSSLGDPVLAPELMQLQLEVKPEPLVVPDQQQQQQQQEQYKEGIAPLQDHPRPSHQHHQHHQHHSHHGGDADTISDVSFSEYSGLVLSHDMDDDNTEDGGVLEEFQDEPPKTPSRQQSDDGGSGAMYMDSGHDLSLPVTSPHSTSSTTKQADVSPIPPQRSADGTTSSMSKALPPVNIVDDNSDDEEGVVTIGIGIGIDDSAPPKLPTRKSSFAHKKKVPPPPLAPPPPVVTEEPPKDGRAAATATPVVVEPKAKAAAPMTDPLPSQQEQQQLPPSLPRPPPTSNDMAHANTTTTDRKKDRELQQLLAQVQALQTQLKKTNTDLKNAQSEGKQFKKTNKTLATKLETADAEINAQREELLRAGERIEKDRKRAQEEREDLLDDHDEELDQLASAHDTEQAEQKTRYEQQLKELQDRLQSEETRRMQEGGDYTQDLEDALQREREALKKLSQVETAKTALQSNVSKLEMLQMAWTTKVESLTQTQKTAAEREREAEDKLDAALSLQARQMSQRQSREAGLEQTILDLSVALTVSRQKEASQMVKVVQQKTAATPGNEDAEESLKDKYERTAEELETVKVQLSMETQRREALQQELNEISKERTEEASSAQARQMQHDRKVADLESTISRLQASLREQKNGSLAHASSSAAADPRRTQELEDCKRQIAGLSEQLLRQQGRAEASKSEILALKGRLQSATIRAEEAEKKSATAQMGTPSTSSQIYQMEGGGVAYSNPGVRRRVKGGMGRVRGGSSSVRSIRSALNLGSGRTGPGMEPIVATIDGIDSWMVDTGSFLRHEPMARLGFLCYFVTLHLWTFALVAFHTTEVPHGDFGSMDNNPRHWREHP